MVYLNKITEGVDAKIAAKLEIMEPCSSVKDRYRVSLVSAFHNQQAAFRTAAGCHSSLL